MITNPFGSTFDGDEIQNRLNEIEARLEDLRRSDASEDSDEREYLREEQDELTELDRTKTYIHENYFLQYAQELACDLLGSDNVNAWPCDCIDWDQAVTALQQDYQRVELAGETYYYRS